MSTGILSACLRPHVKGMAAMKVVQAVALCALLVLAVAEVSGVEDGHMSAHTYTLVWVDPRLKSAAIATSLARAIARKCCL